MKTMLCPAQWDICIASAVYASLLSGGKGVTHDSAETISYYLKRVKAVVCYCSEQMAVFLSCRVSGGGGGRKPNH